MVLLPAHVLQAGGEGKRLGLTRSRSISEHLWAAPEFWDFVHWISVPHAQKGTDIAVVLSFAYISIKVSH